MPADFKVDFDLKGAIPIAVTLEAASRALTGEVVWAVGTPLEYGIYQEFGTSHHPPQPYMRPAARAAVRRAEGHIEAANDIEQAVELIARDIYQGSKERAPVRTGRLRDSINIEQVK